MNRWKTSFTASELRKCLHQRAFEKANLPPERMTPIRIRGKKGQKARLQALREQRANQTPSEASDILDSPPPLLSTLESLPTELLESIFLYSLDVNLPRASLTLGKALSSTHVKQKILQFLLTSPGGPGEGRWLLGKLQSQLLTCRWLDLASLHRALAAAMTSFVEKHLEKDVTGFFSHQMPPVFMPTIAQLVSYVFAHPRAPDEDVIGCWSLGSLEGSNHIEISRTTIWVSSTNKLFEFEVSPGCEMPTRLLHEPWTAEKMEFLGILMEAGAALDPCGSNNAEVADHGLQEAIIQGNTGVVKLLRRKWEASERRICQVGVTLDHVRTAIFRGGCKLEILGLLARPPAYYRENAYDPVVNFESLLDWKQEDILDWANERTHCGDERGRRLLELIDNFERDGRIGHHKSPERSFDGGIYFH
ncbi:MAG: hypothetical protein Q9173_007234 [Seirophora scorigena]